jgi:hypothetical protein
MIAWGDIIESGRFSRFSSPELRSSISLPRFAFFAPSTRIASFDVRS